MSTLALSLNLPESLYRRLENRARQTNRSVEEESLEALAAGLSDEDRLPADVEATLSELNTLDDASLELAAHSRFPAESSELLEELHMKRQREGLSEVENLRRSQLMEQYERHMLVRAQAAAILKQRGKQITNSHSA